MALLIDNFLKKKDKISVERPKELLIDRYTIKERAPVVETKKESKPFFERIKGIGIGIGKFAARTGIEAANLITSTLDFAADFLSSDLQKKLKGEQTVFSPGLPVKTKLGANLAGRWKSFYESSIGQATEKMKTFTEDLRGIDFIKPSEEWINASTKDKFTKKLPETILNIGPGVVSSLGMFAINPAVGFAVSAGSVADELKTVAMENGVNEERAELLGLGTGLLIGWLDKIVPDEVFSPQQKKTFVSGFAKRILKTGLKEAGTEILQEDIQLLAEATVREDITKDEVVVRNLMSGLGGVLGGVGAQTTVSFVNGVRSGDIGGLEEDFKVEKVEKPAKPIKVEKVPKAKPIKKISTKLEPLVKEARKYGIETKDINIVGSHAEGTATAKSDFDILITPSEKIKNRFPDFPTLKTKEQIKEFAKIRQGLQKDLEMILKKDVHLEIGYPKAGQPIKPFSDFYTQATKEVKPKKKPKVVPKELELGIIEKQLTSEAKKLLDQVKKTMKPHEVDIKGALQTAKRIAVLAKYPKIIKPEHLAEAVQYSGNLDIAITEIIRGVTGQIPSEEMNIARIEKQVKSPNLERIAEVFNVPLKQVQDRVHKALADYARTGKVPKVVKKPPVKPRVPKKVKKAKPKVTRVPKRQLPVGEGKERVSRLQARLKGALENASEEDIEELGLTTYRQMNQEDQIARAVEYVQNNTEEALRVVRGEVDPPEGILQNSIFAALVELGKVDTDVATQVATLTATRFGQEINILKKILADNPVVMMQDIVKTRIEVYEKKTGKKAEARVKKEVKKIGEDIKAPDQKNWDNFLDSIKC